MILVIIVKINKNKNYDNNISNNNSNNISKNTTGACQSCVQPFMR